MNADRDVMRAKIRTDSDLPCEAGEGKIYKVVRYARGKQLPGDTLYGSLESARKHANFFLACDVGEDRRAEIIEEQA